MTDEELIKRCLAQDKEAQRALYKQYAGKMLAVCKRYARNDLEAEDMLQEGFIRVYGKLDGFKGNGSFEGWIRRIMVNTALKAYSKSSFKNEVIGIDDQYEMSEEAVVVGKLSTKELMKLIQSLPEGYRIVFNLFAIEGYSHAEIAEQLGINEGTSRSQLNKARRWLQERLTSTQKIVYERQ